MSSVPLFHLIVTLTLGRGSILATATTTDPRQIVDYSDVDMGGAADTVF